MINLERVELLSYACSELFFCVKSGMLERSVLDII